MTEWLIVALLAVLAYLASAIRRDVNERLDQILAGLAAIHTTACAMDDKQSGILHAAEAINARQRLDRSVAESIEKIGKSP